MTTILKVVICVLFVFFSSCSKFEEEPKQTTLVPNINEAQAIIGGENWFEDYVNIGNFKDAQVEDNETYQKHQKALQKLLSYDKFPNGKTKESLEELSRMVAYEQFCYGGENISWYHLGLTHSSEEYYFHHRTYDQILEENHKVEPTVECFFKYKDYVPRLLTPKETYNLPIKLRDSIREYSYIRDMNGYFCVHSSLKKYLEATGIPKEIFEDLRIVSRTKNDFQFQYYFEESPVDKMVFYYQIPYKDNYKDYQNDTKIVANFDNLKKFIKKGSLIFIFDKPLEDLYKIFNLSEFLNPNDNKLGIEYWGHMMIVGDWYTNNINKYQMLSYYKTFQKNEDVKDIHYLLKNKFDDNVSFIDYLKHFVFIEAQKDITNNINRMQGFEYNIGVMLTAGNDKRLQEYIKNATCIAVVNINDGYQMSHPNLIDNMISVAYKQLGKPYNIKPSEDDLFTNHYCSGLVWYSFNNQNLNPSLKLLLPKHRTSPLDSWGYWYMPRTICNSPFVYTRVWYKR